MIELPCIQSGEAAVIEQKYSAIRGILFGVIFGISLWLIIIAYVVTHF